MPPARCSNFNRFRRGLLHAPCRKEMHSRTERDAEIRLWAFLTQARSFARPQQPLKHRGLFGHGVPRWTTVLAAGATGPYSQIALSDAHSPAVNSGGPVKGPSSLFMRAR